MNITSKTIQKMAVATKSPLTYNLIHECPTTKARVGLMSLLHGDVNLPVFMPVGTQGTLKGITSAQLYELNCQIILANTYHLGERPGTEILEKAGGLHKFMNWNRGLLTDSGGFQMVSLSKLAVINEEGVVFQSPFNNTSKLLTPEESIRIQNVIGADIMMQLDDVVKTTTTGPRVLEAKDRTLRWLDRCIDENKRNDEQSIFPIVQGGLDRELRIECANELMKRDVRGYAVGGLSGGESKDEFWNVVHLCTGLLPKDKPRYLMGVGFAADLVVCVALGIDMFDCVFPTRTARFGCALTRTGQLNLKQSKYELDMNPIDKDCPCSTCKTYTRSYLHQIVTAEAVASSLLSIHNVAFQLRLMKDIRQSILNNKFPEFIKEFMIEQFPGNTVPSWIRDALAAVNVHLDTTETSAENITDNSV